MAAKVASGTVKILGEKKGVSFGGSANLL